MGIYQGNDLRKISGGLKRPYRKHRKYEMGSYPTETKVSNKDIRVVERVFGGNKKVKLYYAATANVLDPKSRQFKKVKILSVIETPANRDFARRGIIVKGSIIQTEIGKAKVISRPGQDGVINAVLIES